MLKWLLEYFILRPSKLWTISHYEVVTVISSGVVEYLQGEFERRNGCVETLGFYYYVDALDNFEEQLNRQDYQELVLQVVLKSGKKIYIKKLKW